MSEIRDVLAAISALSARGEPMALATIVATRGSTYRRAGARLLIPAEGEPIGNLSGGCLEDDVARIGRGVMATGQPTLLSFDMTAEGDEVWGYGLGCNGAIDVFVEPAAMAIETAKLFLDAMEANRAAALVTVVESSDPDDVTPGTRLFLDANGERRGSLGTDGELEREALEAASTGLGDGLSRLVELRDARGSMVRAFVEVAWPPLRVVVCGAGHDAIPLVHQAAAMGWNVIVADIRRPLLSHVRFQEAAGFVDANPPEAAESIGLDSRTAVVVMTHNYLRDMEYLRSFAEAGIGNLAYLGLLGPRGRTRKVLAELETSGCVLTDADRSRLHAPAGLDLGAEEPEEVAAAIVAEILAVERGHSGRPLRETSGPIHGA